jgi:hypothetical protein
MMAGGGEERRDPPIFISHGLHDANKARDFPKFESDGVHGFLAVIKNNHG